MRPFLSTLAMLVTLLALSGCNPFDHDYNTPDPQYLTYHTHPFIINFHVVNRASDTVGFTSALTTHTSFRSGRSYDKHISRNWADLGYFHNGFQFLYDDTLVHACTTEIRHFIEYQRKYGGDTTRFGVMDRYGDWVFTFALSAAKTVLNDGDTVAVMTSDELDGLPDTVRANGRLEWDMTFDMDGLMRWDPSASRYTMNADRITITQR